MLNAEMCHLEILTPFEDLQQHIANKIEEINGTRWILHHFTDSVKIRAQMCINMGGRHFL
ncbi:hypothetical protein NQ318_009055 [Aromia moschata]|uniref:Uncharacterized protein n=1 Tax=Aromia moschata TaxID=1265417 RepID=A0AAV8YW05_9CUCU|nr:hypothetical protein NQ318_009055 [Aromia moschata]